jgi:predicted DNA-binding transcriptional regulator AlpA
MTPVTANFNPVWDKNRKIGVK